MGDNSSGGSGGRRDVRPAHDPVPRPRTEHEATAAGRGEPPVHPLHTEPDDPPPPTREQLPLPRRAGQSHLEPQLRTPGSAGDGTPFAAFAAPVSGRRPEDERDAAAAFHEGTQRGRGDGRGATRRPPGGDSSR